MSAADIGLIGLAVMGENLALNIESRGFRVACYNRTPARVDAFLAGRARGRNIIGCYSLEELVRALSRPRKILLMVRAGAPVDELIGALRPLLEPGDVIVDGGNSHYSDSDRRAQTLAEFGLLFVGAGISGGEEGALTGPSIMPGGHAEAWPLLRPILQRIAAQVDGSPCCEWIGPGGAGHFAKMVHNGIEYADMQLIAEAYLLLRDGLGLSADAMAEVFREWNQGELSSYLIEITADILSKKDDVTGQPLVDVILDAAGQKGTGKWTLQAALDLAAPAPTIAEAVFARLLSAQRDERLLASTQLSAPRVARLGAVNAEHIRRGLYASKICAYAQGFRILREASERFGWGLDLGTIARIWRGGCIIRAAFLSEIFHAFAKQPNLPNLLLADYFKKAIRRCQASWRRVVAAGARAGLALPAFASALAYYDGYRSARLPTNLIQAQRDYFGAHTYERVDKPRGEFFHTNWTGRGGPTASTPYSQ